MLSDQLSEAWFAARLGKVTASRVADVMAKTKSGTSASRKNYMHELLCQRLTGEREEGYESAAMKWGTETEPFARAAYETRFGILVEEVGFIDHPTLPNFGASPDGLIGKDGGIEIKCPNTATHVEFITVGSIDMRYVYQMQTAMSCTGRDWWDFISYDPRLPDKLSLFVQRVPRATIMIEMIEEAVAQFNVELDALVDQLRGMM